MNVFEQLCQLTDRQIEKVFSQIKPIHIPYLFLALEDDAMIERLRFSIPLHFYDVIDVEMDALKQMKYTQKEVLDSIEIALNEFKRVFGAYRLKAMFKEKKL